MSFHCFPLFQRSQKALRPWSKPNVNANAPTTTMALSNIIYNTFFKRNSESGRTTDAATRETHQHSFFLGVFVSSIFVGAFAFTLGFDQGLNAFWDRWNKGKQWKDIRDKYTQPTEDSE